MFVGHVRLDNIDDLTVRLQEQNPNESYDEKYEPNAILSWIYPSVTDGKAWGVAATYYVNRTDSIEMIIDSSGEMKGIIEENSLVIPSDTDGMIHISSSRGLEHDSSHVMGDHITITNAIEFELYGASHGHYEITVSGSGLDPADATVDVLPRYAGDFELKITPIPAKPNKNQDIAMVSVLDETGSMIDAKNVLGAEAHFTISSDAKISDDTVYPVYSGSAIIHGVLSDFGHITAVMDGVDSAESDITPIGIAKSIELLVPPRIHTGEAFPFAVHEVDSLGIPIRVSSDWKISSPLGISVIDGLMVASESGDARVSVISPVGASEYDLSGFENKMEVDLDLARTDFRVGEEIILDVVGSVKADYTLVADYPFEKTDSDTFTILLDSEDESSIITILATRQGYEPVSVSETINVKKIFTLDVHVTDSDGRRLGMPFEITIGDNSDSAVSPYHTEFGPANLEVVFPDKKTVQNQGYAFADMRINGENSEGMHLDIYPSGDIVITAVYDEEILINVIDGQGSGVYRNGDTFHISAPDKNKMWFLVRDVFDHWEGINASSSKAALVANKNMDIVAVYREDYTYLMVIIAVPLIATGVFVSFKNTAGLRWMIENMLEGMFGRTHKKNPKQNSADKNKS